jgi:hypothetical protein
VRLTRTGGTWLLLAALGVALGIGLVLRRSAASVRQLPDGTSVTLAKVSFGKRHSMRRDNRWQDRLYPLLPEALARRLGCRYEKFETASDRWLFWAAWTVPFQNNHHVAFLYDEHGCFIGRSGHCSSVDYLGLSPWFEGFGLAPAHPNTRTAELRLFPLDYQRGVDGNYVQPYVRPELARFVVPNPAYRPHQPPAADPLPFTRKMGGLEFTILEFCTGVDRTGHPFRSPRIPEDAGSKARVIITENGQRTKNWVPTGILQVLDGNRTKVEGHYLAWNSSGDPPEYWLQGPPLCSEAIYRMQVGFEQAAGFAENLVCSFQLPVPPGGQLLLTNLEATLHGWHIQIEGVAGTNGTLPGILNREGTHLFRNTHYPYTLGLRLRPPRAPAAHAVPASGPGAGESEISLVEARDDQGREIGLPRRASWNEAPESVFYGLNVPPGARSMTLRFAFVQPLLVEFNVKPTRFQPKLGAP